MRHRRVLLYVALALAVPVPAFAFGIGGSGPGSETLDTRATLDGCGTLQDQIVCKIDATFNRVAGADHYTASITAPDSSVTDYGTVAAGSASLWVPYVGNGTYVVGIDAWGDSTPDEQQSLVTSDKTAAGGGITRGDGGTSRQPDTARHSRGRAASEPARRAHRAGHAGTASDGSPPASCEPATVAGGDRAATPEAQAQLPDLASPPDCPDPEPQPDTPGGP